MKNETAADGLTLKVIAHIESDFPTKFGIPHQSSRLESLKARIVFEPEYRSPDAFRGLEEYSHIWLVWEFSENRDRGWSPTVRPPRLGGNIRKGVFATRSPFRPNPIGLSSVKLERVEMHPTLGPVLHVSGADLMSGTPVYDIKPYLAAADSHPEASGGFTDQIRDHKLQVDFPKEWQKEIPPESLEALTAVLANDPRPGYQKDPNRVYGLAFGKKDIHFRVDGERLTVCGVDDFNEA
jgi:tRNA-Thr(GGU) m(6)t(6)A37 methyltransferase TsaA